MPTVTPTKPSSKPAQPSFRTLITGKTPLPFNPNAVLARDGSHSADQLTLTKPTSGNKVELLVGADQSRLALLKAIKEAQESFWIEMFIWHNDESGREVAQALIDRKKELAAQGKPFDAKILIDWGGLRDATNPTDDREIVKLLRDNGIETLEFNVGGFDPLATGMTPITHRKLMIQDGKQFLTGGRNIGDEYLKDTFYSPKKQVMHAWHDLMFSVEGLEVGRIQQEFLKNWKAAGGKAPARIAPAKPALGGTAKVQSVVTDPTTHSRELREAQLRAIRTAQTEIRLQYPYMSDDAMVDALIEAKKANPKLSIKVLMPGVAEKGIPGFLYKNLNVETAHQLLQVGIDVRFNYETRIGNEDVETFSHFKGMVVDGKLLSIGSANGDARTLAHNHELNCLIVDVGTAKKFIDDVMEPDWKRARPFSEADYAKLPFWKKWLMKALEFVDFVF